MSLPLQDVLKGKYEILEKIGEGGIGAVYKVRHRLLEEIRVIKVLRPEAASKQDLRERFLHEARMAIRLKHPHIAQLHDFSIAEDGRAYIVMEFIDGVALDSLIDASGPPSVDLALEISRQGLMALHYLHENDFVHRDVSPDNVMLTSSFDGRPLVKLIDLGIARHLGAEVRLTATGVFLGKARYCSPEQFQAGGDNPAEVDRRGDIYSFGIMLYELLTGVYPLQGNNFAELAGSHLFHPPKPFEETDPDGRLPDGLRQAVIKAMAKVPEDRFDTAADLAAELEKYSNPEAPLRDEFGRTVEIATTAMPRIAGHERPGSTQDRLNLEFGMEGTPSPSLESTANISGSAGAPRRPLADCVREIGELVARGKRRRALRALNRALADHGTAQPLIELRAAIDQLAESGAWSGKLPRAPLVAGAVLILAGALGGWWWLSRAPAVDPSGVEPASGGAEMIVSATPRWDPAAVASGPTPFADAVDEPPADTPVAAPEPTGPAADGPTGTPTEPGPPGSGDPGSPAASGDQPSPQTAPGTPSPAAPSPAPQVTQEVFERGAVGVLPPVLLEPPRPNLPDDARKLSEELTVVLRVLVEADGTVSRALIASGPTFRKKYREAAIEAAERTRYRPARRGNTLGRMWTELRVVFSPG